MARAVEQSQIGRHLEIRPVEHVEELGAQAQLVPFGGPQRLVQGGAGERESGAAQCVAAQVAIETSLGQAERQRVEPLARIASDDVAAQEVRPLAKILRNRSQPRAIKADPSLAPVRLVLLTSVALRGQAARARQAGVAGYLSKPVRQAQLFDCLATVMGAPPDVEPTRPLITRHSLAEARGQARPRVLVAEDNAINQKVAVRLLEKLGYRADVVANGAEAVAAVAQIPYAAVLMDCQMPEMDGFAATTVIRARRGERSRIPIIAMTANALQGDRERCLAAGMDDYVSKPVQLAALETALERWIPRGRPVEIAADPATAAAPGSAPAAPAGVGA